MAERDPAVHENMAPLSKLSDYEVADDSVDVRGWKVHGSSGAEIGEVDDLIVDATSMQARYLVVSLTGDTARTTAGTTADITGRTASSHPVLVPVSRARIDDRDKYVHLDSSGAGLAALPRYSGETIDRDYNETFGRHEKYETHDTHEKGRTLTGEEQRITRSAEELRIGKRKTGAGEVHVRKHVETERVTEPVTRTREEAYVERRPVSGRESSRPEIRDDEVRIPLTEEEVVVDKRPVVKEEIVVGKRRVQETEQVEADLRKEEVDVDQPQGREHYRTDPKTRRER
jgi:uncharacterized protein (TIGR02271 family)